MHHLTTAQPSGFDASSVGILSKSLAFFSQMPEELVWELFIQVGPVGAAATLLYLWFVRINSPLLSLHSECVPAKGSCHKSTSGIWIRGIPEGS